MSEYITSDQLENRLTEAGLEFIADSDNDGDVEAGETTASVTTAIAYAGQIVDGYICGAIEPEVARGAGNAWLQDRCLDIAAYRAAGHGGRDIQESFEIAHDQSIELLKGIQEGGLIPGFPYPAPVNAPYTRRLPQMANWNRQNRGKRR